METRTTSSNDDRISRMEEENSRLREEKYFLEQERGRQDEAIERYRIIAEFTHDWDFWLNTKLEISWMSPSSSDLTGYASDEFVRNPSLFYEIILPEDVSSVRHFLHDVNSFMQLGQSITFRILTRTRQLRWCELNSKSVFDRSGHYLGQRCSIRDISKLKNALGHIREITEEKLWETKTNRRYRDELAGKERELMASVIRIAQQHELIAYLRKNLAVIKTTLSSPMQQKVAVLLDKVEEHQRMQRFNWEEFKSRFESVNQGFFHRLVEKFPLLTAREQRLCAYIHLGLSSKEIAGLVNVTPESAEISRVRLRRKLELSRSVNLTTFLQQI